MFQLLGVFAEFERSMIRERVLSGMARNRVLTGARPAADVQQGQVVLFLFVSPIAISQDVIGLALATQQHGGKSTAGLRWLKAAVAHAGRM